MNIHHNTIIDAIQNRQALSLTYDNIDRIVEPHAYGKASTGNELLRCYQTSGGHSSDTPHDWNLMNIKKITNLSVSGTFSSTRPGYKQGDKALSTIYAQL